MYLITTQDNYPWYFLVFVDRSMLLGRLLLNVFQLRISNMEGFYYTQSLCMAENASKGSSYSSHERNKRTKRIYVRVRGQSNEQNIYWNVRRESWKAKRPFSRYGMNKKMYFKCIFLIVSLQWRAISLHIYFERVHWPVCFLFFLVLVLGSMGFLLPFFFFYLLIYEI